MRDALAWIAKRRTAAALVAAVFVTLRVARWLVGVGWSLGGVRVFDEAGDFLTDHWLLTAGALAAVFALAFVGVRAAIGWADRRSRRKQVSKERSAGAEPPAATP